MVLSTAGESNPMSNSETDRHLLEIRDEVRELRSTVNRLLIGNGSEGALGRLTKLEQRQGFLQTCYLWLLGGFAWLAWMVIPGYFNGQK